MNGPDQIKPTEELFTITPDGCVCLKIPKCGKAIETIVPISVPGQLCRTATTYPNKVALAVKNANGKWHKITFKEYEEQVRTCAKAFINLGLERHHSVCIIGHNSPEWFISDLAAIYAGGFAAGIYTTNSSEACHHCLENSRANIVVVQDDNQLQKILLIRDRLPKLKTIIQYEGEPSHPDVLSWNNVMQIGKKQTDAELENILKSIAVNECCTLVYTSGTVGNPKAVMLSHDNLIWDALAIRERLRLVEGEEVIISYLPLSHVAAQIVDIYITMNIGATVYFADKNAFKGSLLKTLQEVQPTRFLGVPRVWEKMYERIRGVEEQSGFLKKSLFSWARGHALERNINKIKGISTSTWGYSLANVLILKRIKTTLGLGRCKTFVSSAAPLSSDIKKYYYSIDILLMEAFGMSESSGSHTLCTEENFGLSTIGPTISGTRTKIHEPDEHGNGELCMYGRNIFMGYLNDIEKTSEAIDADGWLHSGDIGYIDQKGLIYITGRLKELLITAGGENIPPVPIEHLIKSEAPHVSNALLIGDKRKFLSVLLTLKTEIDLETGTPRDELTTEVKGWLKELGCPVKTVTELLKTGPDNRILAVLNQAIDLVNEKATSNAQRIRKFVILPADFSLATGELGPTMKVKRNVVLAKYADIIDQLYAEK